MEIYTFKPKEKVPVWFLFFCLLHFSWAQHLSPVGNGFLSSKTESQQRSTKITDVIYSVCVVNGDKKFQVLSASWQWHPLYLEAVIIFGLRFAFFTHISHSFKICALKKRNDFRQLKRSSFRVEKCKTEENLSKFLKKMAYKTVTSMRDCVMKKFFM